MESIDKKTMLLWRMAISAAVFFIAGLVITAEPFRTITYIAAIVILLLDLRPAKSFVFYEQLICVFLTAGAVLTGRPSAAFAITFFFQVVRYIESRCAEKATKPMDLLSKLCSETAEVERNGEYVKVPAGEVKTGDTIVVKAGERIPLDGVVVTGDGFMDMRAFTGEAAPRELHTGDMAVSGAINFGSTMYIRTTRRAEDCAAQRILALTSRYGTNTASSDVKLTRIYDRLTISLLSASALLALMAVIFRSSAWVYTLLTAAAVLSLHPLLTVVRTAFAAAILGAGIDGVLFGGGKYVESLAKSKEPEKELVINAKEPVLAVDETLTTGKTAIITDEPRLDRAVGCAKRTVKTVRISIVIAVLVKAAVIVLALLGHIGIWGAVIIDSIVSIVLLNTAAKCGKRSKRN